MPRWGSACRHPCSRPSEDARSSPPSTFTLEAGAIYALIQLVDRPAWFVVLSGLVFFAWGNIYSLFPAAIGDVFGPDYATANYGIQYTAKGTAAILSRPPGA